MKAKIKDIIEMKGRVAQEFGAEGLVLIYELPERGQPITTGDPLLILRNDGWMTVATAGETREHGTRGRSCFVGGLKGGQVPIGAELRWGSDIWPDVQEVSKRPREMAVS